MNFNTLLLYLKRVSVNDAFLEEKNCDIQWTDHFYPSVDNLINRVYISPLILIENCSLRKFNSFTNLKKIPVL